MEHLLASHESPETAFIVADYPYGFRLRCQIRYWLEFNPKKGTRFCSQTTNPKRGGIHWNAPKKSTYCYIGAVMYFDEVGHVQWSGLSEYSDAAEAAAWLEKHRNGLGTGERLKRVEDWIKVKRLHEEYRKEHPIRLVARQVTPGANEPIPGKQYRLTGEKSIASGEDWAGAEIKKEE